MAMKYFSLLAGIKLDLSQPQPYVEKKPGASKVFQMPKAKEVTLAEYNPVSRDAITAHHLSDYRHKRFSLILLPNIHVVLEDLLSTEGLTDVSM